MMVKYACTQINTILLVYGENLNITMILLKTSCDNTGWIQLAQDVIL